MIHCEFYIWKVFHLEDICENMTNYGNHNEAYTSRYVWFSLAQLVRSQIMNLFNWLYLYWSAAFESDPDLSVRKLHILWGYELLELGLCQM